MSSNELTTGSARIIVQANTIAGGIHAHLGRPAGPPAWLPTASRLWVNRNEESDWLARWCGPHSAAPGVAPAAQITGPGGVGKSALAVRFAHLHRDRFPDGQIYLKLDASHPDHPVTGCLTVPQLLRRVIHALGVPAEETATGLDELLAMYRSVTADRAFALLLDDAPALGRIDLLIPANPKAMVIVTARHPVAALVLDHVPQLPLARMADHHAHQLLTHLTGRPVPGHIARQLTARSRGMPDALALQAAWLRHQPDEVHQADLDAYLVTDTRTTMDTSGGAEPWIDYAFESLAPTRTTTTPERKIMGIAAQRLYQMLALYPGRQIDSDLLAALTATILDTDAQPTTEGVDTDPASAVVTPADLLVEVGLYHEEPDPAAHQRRITIPTAVHGHAVRAQREAVGTGHITRRAQQAAVRVMCDYVWVRARRANALVTPYRAVPDYESGQPHPADLFDGDPHRALDWLDDSRHLLFDLARLALEHDLPQTAVYLLDALWPVWLHRKHRDLRARADRLAVRATHAWGLAAMERYRRDAGESEAAELWAATRECAAAMKRLGRGLARRGRHQAATSWLTRAYDTYEVLGDRHGMVSAREALADQHRQRGTEHLVHATAPDHDNPSHDVAVSFLHRAVTGYNDVLHQRRGLGSARNIGLALHKLGDTHLCLAQASADTDINHLDVAAEYLFEALAVFDDSNLDPYNPARVLHSLGRIHLLRGKHKQAQDELAKALEVFLAFDNQQEALATLLLLADAAAGAHDSVNEAKFLNSAQRTNQNLGKAPDPLIEQRLAALRARPEQSP